MEARVAAAALRQRVEELEAERRVTQDSMRAMRQECTERWVSEAEGRRRGGAGRGWVVLSCTRR